MTDTELNPASVDDTIAFIVFGPRVTETSGTVALAMQKSNSGGRVLTARTASELRQYWPTDVEIVPCTLVFAHFLPPKSGIRVKKSRLRDYQTELNTALGESLGVSSQKATLNWIVESSAGFIDLFIKTPKLQSSDHVRAAQAMQNVFDKWCSDPQHQLPAKRWWEIWK